MNSEETSDQTTTVPDFIQPKSIAEMTAEEHEELLEGLRVRRLTAFTIYIENEEIKEQIRDEKIKAKLAKKNEQLGKQIDRCDALLDKVLLLINEIRALRLQGNVDPGVHLS